MRKVPGRVVLLLLFVVQLMAVFYYLLQTRSPRDYQQMPAANTNTNSTMDDQIANAGAERQMVQSELPVPNQSIPKAKPDVESSNVHPAFAKPHVEKTQVPIPNAKPDVVSKHIPPPDTKPHSEKEIDPTGLQVIDRRLLVRSGFG